MQPDNTTAFFPRKSRVTGVTLAMLSLLFLPPVVNLKGATTGPAASPTPPGPADPEIIAAVEFRNGGQWIDCST